MRRVAAEKDRQITGPTHADQNFYVRIVGELEAQGKGLTEDAAHRAAEELYERRRAELVKEGEDIGREALVEKVADVLYAYHHSAVLNGGRGFPPGTPLPHAAPAAVRNHFIHEARLWLAKAEAWKQAGEASLPDPAAVRGQERGGFLSG